MFETLIRHRKAPLAALALIAAPFASHAACTGENTLAAMRLSDPATYASITSAADQVPHGEGIFWRVDAPGIAPSYLFGTKHLADRPVAAEMALMESVLADARLLMVELSPEERADMNSSLRADPTIFMDRAAGTVTANIPPDLVPYAKEVFSKYSIPFQAADRIYPWFLQMTMATPPCASAAQAANPDGVMDIAIANAAIAAGIDVQGLERWQDQMDVFRTISDHDAKAGLVYMIKTYDERANEHQTVSDLYDTRQIALIWEFSRWASTNADYDFETTPEAHFAELERALLTERNGIMVDRSRAEIAKGGVIIAVGALHMIGQSGLVAAFQREGYNVTRLE